MYLPKAFEQSDLTKLHALIQAHPLATVIVQIEGRVVANHIPLQLCPAPPPYGCLRGHLARANPLVADLAEGGEALAIFHGPDAYISPSWYASKQETGKVVPTWNYAVVHVHGSLRLVDERDWLWEQLTAFTETQEAGLAEPWGLTDAPADFIEQIMAGIIGVELTIKTLEGKFKLSQNQPLPNQASVIAGLKTSPQPNALTMAEWMEAGMTQR